MNNFDNETMRVVRSTIGTKLPSTMFEGEDDYFPWLDHDHDVDLERINLENRRSK